MSDGILLIGASGLAREVLAAGITGVAGILDDDTDLHGIEIGGIPVLGALGDAAARTESLLVCMGRGQARRHAVARLGGDGVDERRYATFIAPSARVGRSSHVLPGTIILDGAVVTADVAVGRHVVVMPNSTLTHDDVLEDFATLAAGVSLGGSVRVGEAAYIGMNASVRQGLRIGAAATVGMGSVVLDDVPAGSTWAGVPARRIGGER